MNYVLNGNVAKFYTCYDSAEEIAKAKTANPTYWTCKRRGVERNSSVGLFTEAKSLVWSDELGYSASAFIEDNLGCNTYYNNLQYDRSAKEFLLTGGGD